MSNEPVTVTYSLEEVLSRFERRFDQLDQKLDRIDERLTSLEVGQATLTQKIEGIDARLKVVEGTQKNQVWTLIIFLTGVIV
jgi:phage shock protein A